MRSDNQTLQGRAAKTVRSFLVLCFKKELLALLLFSHGTQAASVVSLNLCTDQLLVLLAPEQATALESLARDPALSFVWRQAAHIPTVRADAEAVLALHPDLVLAGAYGAQTTLALLRARGVRVVQVEQPTDFAAVRAQLIWLAKLLGQPARGAAVARAMQTRLDAIHPHGGTAVLWEAGGWSAGPGSFEDAVLRAAGFRNLGTGGRMGLEALLARRPDLLAVETSARFPSMATDLAHHPALAGLPRRAIEPSLLACAGPFSVAAVEELAR